jgi:hypothetical protein
MTRQLSAVSLPSLPLTDVTDILLNDLRDIVNPPSPFYNQSTRILYYAASHGVQILMDSMGKTKICLKYPWVEPSNMGEGYIQGAFCSREFTG